MTKRIKKRAVNKEQKAARRRQILEAAHVLFAEGSYDAVSMVGVARRAGVAKGTLYLYFQTKESLFLALQSEQFTEWFDEIDERLQQENGRLSAHDFIQLVGQSLARRPTFTRLIAILHTVLEHNISLDAALTFKRFLRDRVLTTGSLLEDKLDGLPPGQGVTLLMQIYALVIGFQHLAAPAPIIRETINSDETLAIFDIDFTTGLLNTLQMILETLLSKQETNHV